MSTPRAMASVHPLSERNAALLRQLEEAFAASAELEALQKRKEELEAAERARVAEREAARADEPQQPQRAGASGGEAEGTNAAARFKEGVCRVASARWTAVWPAIEARGLQDPSNFLRWCEEQGMAELAFLFPVLKEIAAESVVASALEAET